MTAQTRSGSMAKLLDICRRNQDLLRNAGSLAGTTGLTSLLGAVFWIIAAREFSPKAVGYGSAATSATVLLGVVGEFGLGTMLIGELPKRRERGGLCLRVVGGQIILCRGSRRFCKDGRRHFGRILPKKISHHLRLGLSGPSAQLIFIHSLPLAHHGICPSHVSTHDVLDS